METPVHDSLVIVALGGRQDALVVVGELDEVHSVALAVISIHFLAALQVIQTHAEVFAASHEVLAVVADVHRVDLLLLSGKRGLVIKS